VADVLMALQFAQEHDLTPCIKGGGHNVPGSRPGTVH
jgi:hypothetical protein